MFLSIYISLSHPLAWPGLAWPLISDTNYTLSDASHTFLSIQAAGCQEELYINMSDHHHAKSWGRADDSNEKQLLMETGEQSIDDLTRTPARDDWPLVCEQCQYWFSVRAGDLCGDNQQQQWQQGRDQGGDSAVVRLPEISIFGEYYWFSTVRRGPRSELCNSSPDCLWLAVCSKVNNPSLQHRQLTIQRPGEMRERERERERVVRRSLSKQSQPSAG